MSTRLVNAMQRRLVCQCGNSPIDGHFVELLYGELEEDKFLDSMF